MLAQAKMSAQPQVQGLGLVQPWLRDLWNPEELPEMQSVDKEHNAIPRRLRGEGQSERRA